MANTQVIYTMEAWPKTEEEPEKRQYTIGMVPKVADIQYFHVAREGAEEAGRDLGLNILFEGPTIADASKQVDVIRQLMDRGVDALAVSANDPELLVPVLREARAQGIRVVTWDADVAPEARELFVNMVDPELLGRHLLDTLARFTGEQGEFAVLTGQISAANQTEWLHWIRVQQQEHYPGMELVEVAVTDDDPHRAYEEAVRLLQTYPHLAGLIGPASVAPPAAAQAVKEAGLAGKVKVLGLSTPRLMQEYLRDGSAQMITLWSPKKLGYLTVALVKLLLEGETPYDGQYIDHVGQIRVNGDVVIMGEPLDFTAENVSQYDF